VDAFVLEELEELVDAFVLEELESGSEVLQRAPVASVGVSWLMARSHPGRTYRCLAGKSS
jgi:hypothetical protein